MAIKKYRMNLLLDMAEAGMAFPQSALMVKRSYLEINREKVTSFVKALIEGLLPCQERQSFGDTGDEKIHTCRR